MNLENSIGENKYEHIYVFGCSHSLNTNSIDNTCKTYSENLADNLNIPYKNIYNYSINGSSNIENLYYLNCINTELSFYHSMSDIRYNKYGEHLPTKIHNNSLIIFQLTYWYRNAFQHTIDKNKLDYKIIPIYYDGINSDDDINKFNEIYYKKLSNEIFLQRNIISSTYYTLKGISNERNNVSSLIISWDKLKDDNIQKYIPLNLSNLKQKCIDNKWTCDSEIKNNDLHLSPIGNVKLAEYLYQFI